MCDIMYPACITYLDDCARLRLISYMLGCAYCPALYLHCGVLHYEVLHCSVLHRKTDTHILANEFADMIKEYQIMSSWLLFFRAIFSSTISSSLIHWERRGSRIPWSLGRGWREPSPGFHIFLDLINKDSLGTESRVTIILIKRDLGNESSMISGFHKTEREGARPEAYPVL